MTDPTNPPKIRDVARLAGVSVATVSRALSNPAIVSEQARIAVEKAVAETGYTVNLMARNLRQQQVGAVLALVPNLANPFFSEILAGISDTLRAEGLSLLVLDTLRTDPDTPNGGIRSYLSRSRADGVIVLDGTLDPALFAHGSCPPLVQACEWIEGLAGPRVLADNETGARLAIEHLLGLGHRDIVHLTGPAQNTLSISRAAGVDAALAAAGLPPAHRLEGAFTLSSGRAAAEALLARAPAPPPSSATTTRWLSASWQGCALLALTCRATSRSWALTTSRCPPTPACPSPPSDKNAPTSGAALPRDCLHNAPPPPRTKPSSSPSNSSSGTAPRKGSKAAPIKTGA